MEDRGQSDKYRSAWLLAERELEIQQFLSLGAGGWWTAGGVPVQEGGLPPSPRSPVPEPIPPSRG